MKSVVQQFPHHVAESVADRYYETFYCWRAMEVSDTGDACLALIVANSPERECLGQYVFESIEDAEIEAERLNAMRGISVDLAVEIMHSC